MSIEKRTVRVEDWDGNVYTFKNSEELSTSGVIKDSTDVIFGNPNAKTISEGEPVADPKANFCSALFLGESTVDKILFQTEIRKPVLGTHIIGFRSKVSSNISTDDILKVTVYHVDYTTETPSISVIDSSLIKASQLDTKYKEYRYIVDFDGSYSNNYTMRIRIEKLANTSATVYFDNIAIAKNMICPI